MKYTFDPLYQPYPSNRYVITARKGMVCTGSNLASAAGLEILQKGGNAIDAAIATAAALTVVEPTANGIGSDNFAIVWFKDRLYGMNSSGKSPAAISAEKVREKHGDIPEMPRHGWTPVTVSGAPKGWAELNRRFGKLSLLEDLAPAIRYAEEGYPMSAALSEVWMESYKVYTKVGVHEEITTQNGSTETSPVGGTETSPVGGTETSPVGGTETSPVGGTETSPVGSTDPGNPTTITESSFKNACKNTTETKSDSTGTVTILNPDSDKMLTINREYAEWFRTFTDGGRPYEFGDIIKLPNHAKTLRLIGETNSDAFYHGEIADAIERQSIRDGGFIRKSDYEAHEVEWVDPVSVNYRGYDIWELPPNGQGIVALMALNIIKNFDFDVKDKETVRTCHLQMETLKKAFADGLEYITDPRYMGVDFHEFLKDDYGKARAKEIDPARAQAPTHLELNNSGTVYLCTADEEGNMVSLIQSNYMGFGSGITIEGYGVTLQNRGNFFSLDPQAYNCLQPAKKTYHTIIPGFITKGGKAVGPFGIMGAKMQPQAHFQYVMNLIDFNLNPQMALDAPRWQWIKDKTFVVEESFNKELVEALQAMGHDISVSHNVASFGRGQSIMRLDNGVYIGATESRTDSAIASW